MWLMRAYRSDEELAVEQPLGDLTHGELEQRLGFSPTRLGSTPLDVSHLASLADMLHFEIDPRLHYFLDFDADSRRVARGSSEVHVSA